jgi:peptidoglycan/LPS O-acetylase OafA/YrhL
MTGHPEQKPSLDALTGLRLFGAIQVIMHHYLIMIPAFRSDAPMWLKRLVATGPSAVAVFFILSGFVLTYNYLNSDGTLLVSRREFFVARAARILPMYIVGFVFYAPIAIVRYLSGTGLSIVDVGPGPAFWISGILSLLLIQAWTLVFYAWNAPTWSISAEAFFYSVFPMAGKVLGAVSSKRLWGWMAVLWLFSVAVPIYFIVAILGHSSRQTKELWEVGMTSFPLFRLIPFLVGMATGFVFIRRREQPRRSALWLTLVSTAIFITCLVVPTEAERLLENGLIPLFAVLIFFLACGRGTIAKLLANRYMVLLGDASLAIYILHNPLWNYMARIPNIYSTLFERHFPRGVAKPGAITEWNYDMGFGMFAIYLIVLFSLSLLAARYIERPWRAGIRRRFQTNRTAKPLGGIATAGVSS